VKKKSYPTFQDYPPTEDYRSGCKVGWRTYATEEEARECAKAARYNGLIKAGLGYDFGYQSPGHVTRLDNGRFEVCIP